MFDTDGSNKVHEQRALCKNIRHGDVDPLHRVYGYQFELLMIAINLHWAQRKSNEIEQANKANKKPLEIHNLDHFCLFI